MPRTLLPGQRCRILIVDRHSAGISVAYESDETLVEAPNWSPDGRFLVVNGDGLLWRLPVSGGPLEPIATAGVPEINNDHVLAPDGSVVYVSGKDGHLYAVPWNGGEARRITRDHPEGRGYKNYLHGISPDGGTLAVVVGSRPSPSSIRDDWRTDIALVAVSDGATTFVTNDADADDGVDYSADGAWLWFNTERFTAAPGHAQLARARPDGSGMARILVSETVDWFPHPSPDGATLVYLAYPAGTVGHPQNVPVMLRVMGLEAGEPLPDTARDLLPLFGGQGALNVSGWAPDSSRFACVHYPVDSAPDRNSR